MKTPIVQFGTSRFLQAHADLFISDALKTGHALGTITVVQTSGSPQRAGRIGALSALEGFPIIVRGITGGVEINRTERVTSVARSLSTLSDWDEIRRIVSEEADVLISNTGDTGYRIFENDNWVAVPASFPGKLLLLLKARYDANGRPITILPCELTSRNGDVLKKIVLGLQESHIGDPSFETWLSRKVVWANTLVDRIVSEPLDPVGAIAEPYALWAIERQPGLTVPCEHPSIHLVDDLTPYEKLKLHILNLGHTVLADIWLKSQRPDMETVKEIVADPAVLQTIRDIYETEVIPAFASHGIEDQARAYLETTLERFRNPFLDHRLREIANHHAEKLIRRIVDFQTWAPATPMPKLLKIAKG
ncbi:mannitol dehydrogenase family protein [Pararhizobium sp.]|uniref:mannitol dehydrogenase family protein n=1 Tax=Pararhizobium sp. TaxID=1977563 RepID=UPI0027227B9B|nr:mannitol dehydrogenase family protein [Pararhizobium sp.]MDO9416814.1 mannitol dehydrogenase family protein [Pararhizobium sp.]